MKKRILKTAFRMSRDALLGLLVCCLFAHLGMAEDSSAQSIEEVFIEISAESHSVENVFSDIERETSFSFLYSKHRIEAMPHRISLTTKKRSVADILRVVSQETGLQFRQINSTITVKTADILSIQTKEQVQEKIEGTVSDAQSGETLPGVNILVKGTNIGISTDPNGNFGLTVPSLEDTLVVSFVGYQTQEVPIAGRTDIDIALSPEAIIGEEMVVIGYGTTRKEDLTGSVSSVSGQSIENIPASRVDQMLQGRAAGVSVTQVSGAPGAQSVIRIRGSNSIQGDNSPLYVIDGAVVGSDFNLNNLNSNDIESIEILKDATAVAIYGTRGSNGVILITTKGGGQGEEPGTPQISFNTYTGMQYMMNTIDMLNGPQHAAYANEDARFRGATEPFADPNDVPDVDWVDQITRDAPISNFDLSVSGQSSDRDISYYVSGNYFNQRGLIRNSGYKRYNFRTNLDFDLSDKVRTGLRLNASRLYDENNKVNLSGALYRAVLPVRAIYDENGEFTAVNPVSGSVFRNPEADIQLKENHDFLTNVIGNLYVEAEPIENLILRSSFAPKIRYTKFNRYNPATLPEHAIINDGGDGRVEVSMRTEILNENTISYSRSIAEDHEIDLLGGFTWQISELEGVNARGVGFANDGLKYHNLSVGSDPTRNVIDSNWGSWQLVSWLGRGHYSFKDKYLLTLVGRIDGSSRFAGSNNEYGVFPSAAVAWQLGQEPFIDRLDFFDVLKLRASYGLSGSQAIGSFRTLSLLSGLSAYFDNTEQTAVQKGRPANRDLKWETTKQLDIGLEASILNGRLFFEADYYQKKTEDLLLSVQIPRHTGFTTRLQNVGSIKNHGLEFKINTVNIINNNFEWSSMVIIFGNRNEVLDMGPAEFLDVVSPTSGPGGRLIVGESVPVFVGVEYLGTWKSQQEIDDSGQSAQEVGGPRFKDTDGDGEVTFQDFEVLGSPQPDFSFGFQNTFDYKNWSLDIFIQGTYGNEIYNSLTQSAFFGSAEANKYAETLDRWTPENPDSDIPRAGGIGATISSVYSNSEMIEDGSHLRLKNLQLGYDVPVEKVGLTGLKRLNVYFSGSNLLLFSKFRLFDPEVSQYGDHNTAVGFSQGEYPYGRTLTFGIKATL